MATTTNYGWTTPDDTALVKDGASAIRSLGSSIDTTTKNLNPSTTLGDIEYRSATANTNTRLAIGTEGQVLTVSSGVPAWNAPSGIDPILTPEESTYYAFPPMLGTSSAFTPTTNTTYYTPIFLPASTYDRIGFTSSTTFTTAGNTRLGLYRASLTTGKPSTLVFDAGVVNVTASGTSYTITINQSLTAGWYYAALNVQSGSYQVQQAPSGTYYNIAFLRTAPSLTSAGNNAFFGYAQTGVTGAFADAGTISLDTSRVVVALRMA